MCLCFDLRGSPKSSRLALNLNNSKDESRCIKAALRNLFLRLIIHSTTQNTAFLLISRLHFERPRGVENLLHQATHTANQHQPLVTIRSLSIDDSGRGFLTLTHEGPVKPYSPKIVMLFRLESEPSRVNDLQDWLTLFNIIHL
jgi:hypothetical protein